MCLPWDQFFPPRPTPQRPVIPSGDSLLLPEYAHLFRCAAAIRLRAAGEGTRLAECLDTENDVPVDIFKGGDCIVETVTFLSELGDYCVKACHSSAQAFASDSFRMVGCAPSSFSSS